MQQAEKERNIFLRWGTKFSQPGNWRRKVHRMPIMCVYVYIYIYLCVCVCVSIQCRGMDWISISWRRQGMVIHRVDDAHKLPHTHTHTHTHTPHTHHTHTHTAHTQSHAIFKLSKYAKKLSLSVYFSLFLINKNCIVKYPICCLHYEISTSIFWNIGDMYGLTIFRVYVKRNLEFYSKIIFW